MSGAAIGSQRKRRRERSIDGRRLGGARLRAGVQSRRTSAKDGPQALAQRAAEEILEEINPYVFAVYRFGNRDYDNTIKTIFKILYDSSTDK
jgi:hypothetical protein